MRRYRRLFLLPVDVLFVALSHLLAYLIRFEWQIPEAQNQFFLAGLVVALAVKPAVFFASGFYRRLWRYASIPDLIHIVKAVFFASILSALVTLFWTHFQGYSRSVLLLDWLLLQAFIMGRSLIWRLLKEHDYAQRRRDGQPVLIVGAGMAGRMLFHEIRHNPDMDYSVVGFLDDDLAKVGARVNDRPVLGTISQLRRIARYHRVKKVIIAIPSAPAKLIRSVVRVCQEADLEVQTLPAISNILENKLLAAQIRDVNLEDLLGRDPVSLDIRKIEAYLAGRRVLVSGAGGSIGSEICRQVARFAPKEIILFELAETPLHHISIELERDFPNLPVTPLLADIRDGDQVIRAFRRTKPDVVFHAAACKHVPMMEYNPAEAAKTNILGTRNLARAADEEGVERFVMISTDKAVNPTSVMGASKRAAELFVQGFNETSRTEFVTVRFGNVLGSNGSVVPHFQDQIRRGGPITVTHPDVIRYFMTIPEATQLVLQAGSMGNGGEIFLLDMGEPVKIVDLALDLIRLSGLQPYEDIDIKFTGLRPGEKLFEELLIDGEGIKPTDHEKILVAEARIGDIDVIENQLRELRFYLREEDDDLILQQLQRIVPEYRLDARAANSRVKIHPAASAFPEETATPAS